jgi:hypothetical protein
MANSLRSVSTADFAKLDVRFNGNLNIKANRRHRLVARVAFAFGFEVPFNNDIETVGAVATILRREALTLDEFAAGFNA